MYHQRQIDLARQSRQNKQQQQPTSINQNNGNVFQHERQSLASNKININHQLNNYYTYHNHHVIFLSFNNNGTNNKNDIIFTNNCNGHSTLSNLVGTTGKQIGNDTIHTSKSNSISNIFGLLQNSSSLNTNNCNENINASLTHVTAVIELVQKGPK